MAWWRRSVDVEWMSYNSWTKWQSVPPQEQLLCGHSQLLIFSLQRTEEEFLDQVNRKLSQTSPEKDSLTTKPCRCREVLNLVLSPLTRHCLVIGENTCAFYYLLEAAAASLDLSNNYMVSQIHSNLIGISHYQLTWDEKWREMGERKEP